MIYKKLAWLSLGLALSTSIFADHEKKALANSQPSPATVTDQCPPPQEIIYNYNHHQLTWAYANGNARWDGDTVYPAADKPVFYFLEAQIMTEKGKDNRENASGHVVCSYKMNNWHEIITMQPHTPKDDISRTKIPNSTAWQYIPHQAKSNFGEWRCIKSPSECTFELIKESDDKPQG